MRCALCEKILWEDCVDQIQSHAQQENMRVQIQVRVCSGYRQLLGSLQLVLCQSYQVVGQIVVFIKLQQQYKFKSVCLAPSQAKHQGPSIPLSCPELYNISDIGKTSIGIS
eukprot:TRINITY_DN3293_c0_g1_i1.p2 TRINITY_DN3293_c0_g1~~TRINITY_DN3293_c0_g1_i1.p2  ORF type:complete len:111 (-),score=4.10 TRINITY_DN3293_c0_g1_i1:20-352(-)